MVNKIRGTFNSVAVKAPGFGDRRKAMLQDMAILTGGQVIAEEVGLKLDNATLDLLGTARKVVITKDNTTIVEGAGAEDDVKGRIAQIKREIDDTDSDWDREKLQERLAKLAGGVAVIKVGAATEVELKEKKHRIEDALSATRAAIEEGVVAGGGTALLRARADVAKVVEALEGDEATGARIVCRALEAPARLIADNAGLEGAVVVQQVERETGTIGLNAATGEFEDLLKAGVIDPAKVTRAALQNAASIAGLLLTTEALVADKPEPAGAARRRHAGRHGWHGWHGRDDVAQALPEPVAHGRPPGRPCRVRTLSVVRLPPAAGDLGSGRRGGVVDEVQPALGEMDRPGPVGVAPRRPQGVVADLGGRIQPLDHGIEIRQGGDQGRLLPELAAHRVSRQVPAGVLAERPHAAPLAAPRRRGAVRGRASPR